jgi:hypothetical protein
MFGGGGGHSGMCRQLLTTAFERERERHTHIEREREREREFIANLLTIYWLMV